MHIKHPRFSGLRVMMMPFHTHDALGSLPPLGEWNALIAQLCAMQGVRAGVGYLTIDEGFVPSGETQRRPGLHVDGVDEQARVCGAWGGGGGGWSKRGAILVSSDGACGLFGETRDPGEGGDCAHLKPGRGRVMNPWAPEWIGPLTVHEALPAKQGRSRQFARVSMPSDAPWFEGYTVNPLGVLPTGRILPGRAVQMAYREVA